MKNIQLTCICTLFTAATLCAAGTPTNGPENGPLAFENCPTAPVEFCDFTDGYDEFWNAPYWLNPSNASSNISDGAVDLQMTATGTMSANLIQLHYELSLDLDGDGTQETVIKSKQLPGTNKLGFNDYRAFDNRYVPVGDQYAFALQTAVVNGKRVASLRWNTTNNPSVFILPQLPYGTHSIKWIATDVSFNQITCVQTFVVKDCVKPKIECFYGLRREIETTGLTPPILAIDFVRDATDNVTPADQLVYAVRKNWTGTDFPIDSLGLPISNLLYTCDDRGYQFLELWVMDKAGNTNFCKTQILIEDPNVFCPNPLPLDSIIGYITTPELEPMENVELGFAVTDASGFYSVMLGFPGSTVTLSPQKDGNPLNGVTTFDLILIGRHILGLEPLDSPYKLIAADANKSNTITTFDVMQIQRVILNVDEEFPNNQSWRFVDRAQVFPDPSNPFTEVIRENVNNTFPPTPGASYDFFGVKVGDVNGSSNPNELVGIDDRSTDTLFFYAFERTYQAGEVFDVVFQPAEQPLGNQFTLRFEGLELLEVLPGQGMTTDNFGIFQHAVTHTSNNVQGSFALRFRAVEAGVLSQKLSLDGSITPAEAYNFQNESLDVALRFVQGTHTQESTLSMRPIQNAPNPFSAATVITFKLPADSEVQLVVYDALGRLVFDQKADYTKGVQQIQLDARQLGDATGALFYELRTESGVATGQMMRVKG